MTSDNIYLACQDVIVRAFRALDARKYDILAAFFADDGVWYRMDQELVGPAAVLAAMAGRPADLTTQHLVSNLVIDQDGEEVVANYSISAYAQTADKPFHLHAVFHATDHLGRDGDKWLFLSRKTAPAFPPQS